MSGSVDNINGLVQDMRGVISAVDMLKTAIAGGDAGDIEFATDLLANAASGYSGNTLQYARMGFDEISSQSAGALPRLGRVSDDILASALVDIQVANTLMVAGRAVGETAEPASAEELDTAYNQLKDLTNAVASPLGKGADVPTGQMRFKLDEVPLVAPVGVSPDLPTAKANYEKKFTAALQSLTVETKKVLKASFKEVVGLDEKKLAEAASLVGKTASDLPAIGKLITQGVMLAVQALDKLTKLLGQVNSDDLKKQAGVIISKLNQGDAILDQFLAYSFGVNKSSAQVKALLDATKTSTGLLDIGAKKLADLQTRFAEQMAVLNRLVIGLDLCKIFINKLLPEVVGTLLFGTFYIVIMDYAVLSGMDYADTTTLIDFVSGVIKISEETLA